MILVRQNSWFPVNLRRCCEGCIMMPFRHFGQARFKFAYVHLAPPKQIVLMWSSGYQGLHLHIKEPMMRGTLILHFYLA
jgi:hypothetical protein